MRRGTCITGAALFRRAPGRIKPRRRKGFSHPGGFVSWGADLFHEGRIGFTEVAIGYTFAPPCMSETNPDGSGDDLLDQFAMHVGQAHVAAAEAERQPLVVDA